MLFGMSQIYQCACHLKVKGKIKEAKLNNIRTIVFVHYNINKDDCLLQYKGNILLIQFSTVIL